ncbi:MAG: PA0069 family radical SAM protein [Proteobacteria bacterium]|nr:PA0069 family radical SAM protein [Pseudomonadota bacterium]
MPDPRRRADPLKGRGTATRIAHRFDAGQRVSDGEGAWPKAAESDDADADDDASPAPSAPRTEVTPEQARSILSHNDSPDIPFSQALNPYRGCEHGCIYCYARPTHSYLNLSPGLDFETRLVAKANAAERLAAALQKPAYVCSPINLGSATDVYQPIEREWRLTRAVLEVLDACQHPFTLVTKSAGVLRDVDLLARAAERRLCYVMVSVTSLDGGLSRILEPRAAAPWARLDAVRKLADAGVPVGVNVAPIIPFLNEPEIERIIDAAAQAGAHAIHYTIVRLPWEVRPLFQEWLDHHVPERAERIMARIRDLRGGKDYDARFGQRMKGQGVWGELIRQRVRKAAARHGLGHGGPELDTTAFDPRALASAFPARPAHAKADPDADTDADDVQGTLF